MVFPTWSPLAAFRHREQELPAEMGFESVACTRTQILAFFTEQCREGLRGCSRSWRNWHRNAAVGTPSGMALLLQTALKAVARLEQEYCPLASQRQEFAPDPRPLAHWGCPQLRCAGELGARSKILRMQCGAVQVKRALYRRIYFVVGSNHHLAA